MAVAASSSVPGSGTVARRRRNTWYSPSPVPNSFIVGVPQIQSASAETPAIVPHGLTPWSRKFVTPDQLAGPTSSASSVASGAASPSFRFLCPSTYSQPWLRPVRKLSVADWNCPSQPCATRSSLHVTM